MPKSLTAADADRLERATAEAWHLRGAELQYVEGNPLAIDQRSFGRVQARRVVRDLAYYRYFSGPMRLLTGDEAVVPTLAAWYAEASAPCFARLSPLFSNEGLLRALTAAGLAQTGFLSLLYASPLPPHARSDDNITVREVEPEQDQTFIDLWTIAAPEDERTLRQQLARAEFTHWRRYVAFVGDRPAAHAALFVSAETRSAVLAGAGTRPELRGRGCQTALVLRRMSDAARAGCDLVVVEATPGSPSQRNLERLGMRLAVTQAIWEFVPSSARTPLRSKASTVPVPHVP